MDADFHARADLQNLSAEASAHVSVGEVEAKFDAAEGMHTGNPTVDDLLQSVAVPMEVLTKLGFDHASAGGPSAGAGAGFDLKHGHLGADVGISAAAADLGPVGFNLGLALGASVDIDNVCLDLPLIELKIPTGALTLGITDLVNAFTHTRNIMITITFPNYLEFEQMDKYESDGDIMYLADPTQPGVLRVILNNDGFLGSGIRFREKKSGYYLAVSGSNPFVGHNKTRVYFGEDSKWTPEVMYHEMDSWAEFDGECAVGNGKEEYDNPSQIHYELEAPYLNFTPKGYTKEMAIILMDFDNIAGFKPHVAKIREHLQRTDANHHTEIRWKSGFKAHGPAILATLKTQSGRHSKRETFDLKIG